jgi:tetratricopeptide (TPR) repeat protein
MKNLSWNWYWDSDSSWGNYLRNKDMVSALNGGGAESAKYLSSCMLDTSKKQILAIDGVNNSILEVSKQVKSLEQTISTGTQEIVSSLGELKEEVSYGNQRVIDAIGDLGQQLTEIFTWGFSEALAAIGGMQISLAQLVAISKTPAQTAAYEHFEIARDAFRQGLYAESLEALQYAIDGSPGVSSGYKIEWRFHYLRGLICLGSHNNTDEGIVDPASAERSFLLAARYARKDFPQDASKAMLSAGWSAYVQRTDEKLQKALEYTEEAMALDPTLGEAYFQTSKLKMVKGEMEAAFRALERASTLDPSYILKASADGDFNKREQDLLEFWKMLRRNKIAQMPEEAKLIAKNIEDLMNENSVFEKNRIPQRFVSIVRHPEVAPLVELFSFVGAGYAAHIEKLRNMRISIVRDFEEERSERIVEHVSTGKFKTEEIKILEQPRRFFGLLGPKYRVERTQKPVVEEVSKVVTRAVKNKRRLVVNGLGEVIRTLPA